MFSFKTFRFECLDMLLFIDQVKTLIKILLPHSSTRETDDGGDGERFTNWIRRGDGGVLPGGIFRDGKYIFVSINYDAQTEGLQSLYGIF